MNRLTAFILALAFIMLAGKSTHAEDGYDLWLRYTKISNPELLRQYQDIIRSWGVGFSSPTANVIKRELALALPSIVDKPVIEVSQIENCAVCFITTSSSSSFGAMPAQKIKNDDGYQIHSIKHKGKQKILVVGKTETGVLYGMFHLLRLLQTQVDITKLDILEAPKVKLRILNHWDNLDRTVERGYAGFSLWDWHKLPEYIDKRYEDYARANASIGINGTVLTNVNSNALILSDEYLKKVKALADVFRPYGLKVFLTARFNAPMELDHFPTADPNDASVIDWWNKKARDIYKLIPDFGGFVVKANSEGQPGPQSYQRTHADGANLLARALKPHGGVVMWRAFVYDNNDKTDRAKQAYNEFRPLDGKFDDNVIIQVKNGPIDFQPREPFHPLFGAMPKSSMMSEFQITQEYLGFATHLVYLAPLWKECLDSDTYVNGSGSTVARVVDGSLNGSRLSAMAGVSNIGSDRNWCGHPFAQANWFSFGLLAWDHQRSADQIAEEWIKLTFGKNDDVVRTCKSIMMSSRETTVNYMTPLGLHHLMGWDHHYGPAPWISNKPREDWTSVYYHKAGADGIGFDRTATGSNALEQYRPEVRKMYEDPSTCPPEYLLWFHHLPWDHKLRTGRTLWNELCHRYDSAANTVEDFQKQWRSLQSKIDDERFEQVSSLLQIQHAEARWWRDACLAYFQQVSDMPFPEGFSKPQYDLQYYQSLEFPFAPGIKPKW